MKKDLTSLTCDNCTHLEPNGEDFYWCKIHKREIFDPTKAGCYKRERHREMFTINEYEGFWLGHQYEPIILKM